MFGEETFAHLRTGLSIRCVRLGGEKMSSVSIQTTLLKMCADVSTQNLRRDSCSFMWHQPCQRCKYTTLMDIQKRAINKACHSCRITPGVQELCGSRGGRPGLPVLWVFCGRKATLNHAYALVTVCLIYVNRHSGGDSVAIGI